MESIVEEALMKGVEMHKAGQFGLAKQLYSSVIRVEPKHADANHNIGVIEIDTGNTPQAIPFLRTALDESPHIAQYWISYIDALLRLGAKDDAQNMLTQAKKRGADGEPFDQLQQRIEEINKAPKAQTITNSTTPSTQSDIQEPPQDVFQAVLNLYTQKSFQGVLDEVSQLLKIFPKSMNLHNIQGAANSALGQLDSAILSYKKTLSIQPDHPEAYNNMGVALKNQGKLHSALEAYKKALSIKPDYDEAHNNIGIVFAMQGNLDKAIQAFSEDTTSQ